jgi:uridine phosphorylase
VDFPYPILEFDPSREALIEPTNRTDLHLPKCAVMCFFQDVFEHLLTIHQPRVVTHLRSEIGHNPVYLLEFANQQFVAVHPGVGAPLAAGFLEEIIALGCSYVVACGGAGVLDGSISLGHIIVPNAAVRDEGTSYHYLPPSREVEASSEAIATIEHVLQSHNLPYLVGKTWTTDAFYRETTARIQRRREEGCVSVEMECAAFFAVARFRGVQFGQLLYGGDDVSGEQHDMRGWDRQRSVREQLFWLAAEACLEMSPASHG